MSLFALPSSRLLLLAGLSVVLLLISCKDPEDRSCIKSAGASTSESRDFAGVDEIYLFGPIDYTFIQDSSDHIVIRGGENVISQVTTKVENGTLYIRDENKCHWLRNLPVELEVDIHYSSFYRISSEATGSMRGQGVQRADSFYIENFDSAGRIDFELDCDVAIAKLHAGAPLMTLSGRCREGLYYNSGDGKLTAFDLTAETVLADMRAAGQMEVRVVDGPLRYRLDGYGDILYKGNYSQLTELSRTGTGELIKAD